MTAAHGVARASVAACAMLLGACASLPPLAGVASYTGKFALRVTGAERRDAMSGRFALTVSGADVTLDLSTPLGTTVARLQSGPEGARLTVPGPGGLRTERGADPEALSQKVLGWMLPVSGMPDWIEGRPVAGRPYRRGPADGGAEELEQDGWTIRLEAPDADGRIRRVDMHRPPQGEAPEVSLRVVLDGPAGS